MSNRIEALVIVETDNPFNGIARASVIEKHGDKYSKKTVTWRDMTFHTRNCYYAKGCERERDRDGLFIQPKFYAFTRLTDDIPPVDVCLYTSMRKHKGYALGFEKIKVPLEIPDWTKHFIDVKHGVDNFLRLLQNIQAASPLVSESSFTDDGLMSPWFKVTIAKSWVTATDDEATNYETARTKQQEIPYVEYVKPPQYPIKKFATKVMPCKQQEIVRFYNNALSAEEKQRSRLPIPLAQIGIVSPISAKAKDLPTLTELRDAMYRSKGLISSTAENAPKVESSKRGLKTAGRIKNNLYIYPKGNDYSKLISHCPVSVL